MLRQTPNRRHRWLAPANSDLESSYESRPGYHPVEVHTQAGPTQVSLHNQAVEALVRLALRRSCQHSGSLRNRISGHSTTARAREGGNPMDRVFVRPYAPDSN